jgi:adenine C2-methylase RlmN of 23S rRNA A2503 and tRNA A37
VGTRASLDRCGKSRTSPGFNHRTVQPVTSRRDDYGILTHMVKEEKQEVLNACVIRGFRREVVEISTLLGCETTCSGDVWLVQSSKSQ